MFLLVMMLSRVMTGYPNLSSSLNQHHLPMATGGILTDKLQRVPHDAWFQDTATAWCVADGSLLGFSGVTVRVLIQRPLLSGQGPSVSVGFVFQVFVLGFPVGFSTPWAYFRVCVSVAVFLLTETSRYLHTSMFLFSGIGSLWRLALGLAGG